MTPQHLHYHIYADESNPILFPPKWTRIIPAGNAWFQPNTTPPFLGCEGDNGECPQDDPEFPIGGEGGLSAGDYAIAQQNISDSLYETTSRFRAENYLYEKLTNHPEWLPDTGAIANFYQTKSVENPEKMQEIRSSHQALATYTALDIQSLVEGVLQQKHQQDSLAQTLDSLTADFLQNYHTLAVHWDSVLQVQDSLVAVALNAQSAVLPYILSKNVLINDSEEAAWNEKIINEIYYTSFAQSLQPLTPLQIEVIDQIALGCPASGGDAIYKARSLRAILRGDTTYNDTLTCALQGMAWRKPQTATVSELSFPSAICIPNPAHNQLVVYLPYKLLNSSKCEVFDMAGFRVMSVELPPSTQRVDLNTMSLSNGVYTYRIRGEALAGKFIIQHTY